MLETNKIYNIDCIKGMKQLDDDCIDLTVTSPPYDNLRTYKGFTWDFENTAKQLYRVTKKGGVVVWVVGDATVDGSETGTSFKQALYFKEIGFNIHDTMIYEKTGFSNPSSNRYHQIFEYMFVFSKGRPSVFNPLKDRKSRWPSSWGKTSQRQKDGILLVQDARKCKDYGMRFNVWKITSGMGFSSKDGIAHKHPAIFPEQLAKGHILSWSNKGDTVLDPFCGSGTTLKMAELNSRNWIGFEISEEYCKIAEERLRPIKCKRLGNI